MTIQPNNELLGAMRDALEIFAQLTAHGELSSRNNSGSLHVADCKIVTSGTGPQLKTTITRRILQNMPYSNKAADQRIFEGLQTMGFTCESLPPHEGDTEYARAANARDYDTVVTGPLTEETLKKLHGAIEETLLAQAKDNATGFSINASAAKEDLVELSMQINQLLSDLGHNTNKSYNTAFQVCRRIPSLDDKKLDAAIGVVYDTCDKTDAALRELKKHLDGFVKGATSPAPEPAPAPAPTIAAPPAVAGRVADGKADGREFV